MHRPAPKKDINEDELKVSEPEHAAAGLKAVMVSMERGFSEAGPSRTLRSMLRINQRGGFDCPGCAWPESITGPAPSPPSGSPSTRSPCCRTKPSTGSAPRAASPTR